MDDGGKLGGGLAYRSGLATEISTALALACLTCSELPGRFFKSCEKHKIETPELKHAQSLTGPRSPGWCIDL